MGQDLTVRLPQVFRVLVVGSLATSLGRDHHVEELPPSLTPLAAKPAVLPARAAGVHERAVKALDQSGWGSTGTPSVI